MQQMTEDGLKQAQQRISSMQKMLAGAWAAYKDLEKAVAGVKKEYAIS